MVSESVVVLSAFTLLHIGFVLNLIATASSYWVEGHARRTGNGSVLQEAREGLWQFCDEEACGPIPSHKSPWFIAVEGLHTSGASISLIATAFFYLFCMTTRGRQSKPLISLITFLIHVSWLLILVALALYGANGTSAVTDLLPPRGLGWGYIVATCGLVFTFLSAVCITRELCIIASRRLAYIDL